MFSSHLDFFGNDHSNIATNHGKLDKFRHEIEALLALQTVQHRSTLQTDATQQKHMYAIGLK